MELLTGEEYGETVAKVIKYAKKIINHIKPRRFKAHVTFGMEDPSVTGKILGGAALLYPVYEDNVVLDPDFEHKVLKGDVDLKGRVRLNVIAFAALRLLLDKKFRRLIKEFKRLKNFKG